MELKMEVFLLAGDYLTDVGSKLPEVLLKRLKGYVRSRDLKRLASCTDLLSPEHTRDTWKIVMQVAAFFKKNAAFSHDETCTLAASHAFHQAETICRITNKRLDYFYSHRPERLDDDLRQTVSQAIHEFRRCLGPIREFLNELPDLVRFTNGASADQSRRYSQAHRKIVRRRVKAPPGAEVYVSSMIRFLGLEDAGFRFEPTCVNRIAFVPKNWKTKRTIACEPTGSLPFQLAFDTYAKRRLLNIGVNLRDQSRNQVLAADASLTGSLATIDLQMASDLVSYNLVRLFCDDDWFKFLTSFRCPFGKLPDGSRIRYAKFSSMGNGTTFPLETLVFASLCRAVGANVYAVYGDDIIAPVDVCTRLIRALRFLGFKLNMEKSYVSGPFRESCGVNCYEGVDITPFYVRSWHQSKTLMSHNVNGLLRVCAPGGMMFERLLCIIKREKLRLVPIMEDTTAGVHIPASDAYALGLIRKGRTITVGDTSFPACSSIPHVRVYKNVPATRRKRDLSTYWYWVLGTRNRRELPDEPHETTQVPGIHKTRSVLTPWHPPRFATPATLYWVAEGLDLLAKTPCSARTGPRHTKT